MEEKSKDKDKKKEKDKKKKKKLKEKGKGKEKEKSKDKDKKNKKKKKDKSKKGKDKKKSKDKKRLDKLKKIDENQKKLLEQKFNDIKKEILNDAQVNPELITDTFVALKNAVSSCNDKLSELKKIKYTLIESNNGIGSAEIQDRNIEFARRIYTETRTERNNIAMRLLAMNPEAILSQLIKDDTTLPRSVWKFNDKQYDTLIKNALDNDIIEFIDPKNNPNLQRYSKSTRRYCLKYGLWIPISLKIKASKDTISSTNAGERDLIFEFHLIHGTHKMGLNEYTRFTDEFCIQNYISEYINKSEEPGLVQNAYYPSDTYSSIRCSVKYTSDLFNLVEPLNFERSFGWTTVYATEFNISGGGGSSSTSSNSITKQSIEFLDKKSTEKCGRLSKLPYPLPFDKLFSPLVDESRIDPDILIQNQRTEDDLDIAFDSLKSDYVYSMGTSDEMIRDQAGSIMIPSRMTQYNEIIDLGVLPEELTEDFNNVANYVDGVRLRPKLLQAPVGELVTSWKRYDNSKFITSHVGTQQLHMTYLILPPYIDSTSDAWLLSNQISVPGFTALADLIVSNSSSSSSSKKRKETDKPSSNEPYETDVVTDKAKRIKIKGIETNMRKISAIKNSSFYWSNVTCI